VVPRRFSPRYTPRRFAVTKNFSIWKSAMPRHPTVTGASFPMKLFSAVSCPSGAETSTAPPRATRDVESPKKRNFPSSIVSPIPKVARPSNAGPPVSGLIPKPLTYASGTRSPIWIHSIGLKLPMRSHWNMSRTTGTSSRFVALGAAQSVCETQLTTTKGSRA
jgi:hypothetical protein